ncbi:hypothetical protein B0H17DRAFT_1174220 [Mycena rosella]|uniref:Uncharacterized protein n=1 Tax=Mycena rosella TaxID=1033263 RepID=A0AAD7GZT1_MYCRO|nr:hypothetical protein B0H17DRAFT_1174220 [Mycena rosella]
MQFKTCVATVLLVAGRLSSVAFGGDVVERDPQPTYTIKARAWVTSPTDNDMNGWSSGRRADLGRELGAYSRIHVSSSLNSLAAPRAINWRTSVSSLPPHNLGMSAPMSVYALMMER